MEPVMQNETNFTSVHMHMRVGQLKFDIYMDEAFLHAEHYRWGQELKHNHAAYEIHLVRKGQCVMRIDQTHYHLNEGNSCIIPPGIYHSQQPCPQGAVEKICFRFQFEQLSEDQVQQMDPETEHLLHILQRMQVHVQHHAVHLGEIAASIINELRKRDVGYIALTELLFAQLLVLVIRSSSPYPLTTPYSLPDKTPDDLRMQRIDVFFAQNVGGTLGEDDLARILHVSRRQLNRILHTLYGLSFRKKMLHTRLEVALDLLRNTALSVGEIAERVGYQSPNSFQAAFKANLGMTPGMYRKRSSAISLYEQE